MTKISPEDRREMEDMLSRAGYEPDHARQLQGEGMGSFELRERLAIPSGVGSLSHTHGFRKKSAAELDREIADFLATGYKAKTREELVLAAESEAAMLFVGKPQLTDAMMTRARSKAFRAIQMLDRRAGTDRHPHAAYSHGISTLAHEGVERAASSWRKIRDEGGAAGIRRRHGMR